MGKRIITISREFGSGGRFIGEEVAKKLGIADYILKNRDDVLNVFVHGDMTEKVQRICKLYSVTEADAVKMINDTDKRRRTNYNYYTEQKWGMARNYTLSLNSSVLGYDMWQKIIINCISTNDC